MKHPVTLLLLLLALSYQGVQAQSPTKRRVVVLTDIEADPDDAQSMVRFLTYANEWDVEGLIATTSIHQKNRVVPESIRHILLAYSKVQPNLLKHAPGFPTAQQLLTKVKQGLPVYGMTGVGAGHDSEGSDWVVRVLKQADPRPVWFSVWGGPNVLAQALWNIQQTETPANASRLYRKIRIYTISDQDDSGPWIRRTFPSLFYVVTPGYNYADATWLGMSFPFPGSNSAVTSADWLATYIQQGHGPLGAAYLDVAYGIEGDSPAFLGLISNGLSNPERPDYGGWGGRYTLYKPDFRDSNTGPFRRDNWPTDEPETRPIWTNTADSVTGQDKGRYVSPQATIWRWRQAVQHDFAARMTWCTKAYSACNHPPVPRLATPDSFTVKSGETFHLNASGTTDPDGDSMSYLWFQYPEAGTYPGQVSTRPYAPTCTTYQVQPRRSTAHKPFTSSYR